MLPVPVQTPEYKCIDASASAILWFWSLKIYNLSKLFTKMKPNIRNWIYLYTTNNKFLQNIFIKTKTKGRLELATLGMGGVDLVL